MPKFRRKPVDLEAQQWFRLGDHPAVSPAQQMFHPECEHCGKRWQDHGWIATLEGGHIVCPGDWVMTGVKGEHYPCKPDIFPQIYEAVEVQ